MSKEREREFIKKRSIWAGLASLLSLALAAAVGSLLLFAWIAEEMAEGDTRVFDNALRGWVHAHASEWLTPLMQGCSFFGSTMFLTLAALVVLFAFLRSGHKHSAVLFAVTMIGATVLNWVLKTSFGRERPIPFFDTPLPASYSFPSGHSLFALCFFGSLAWIWCAHHRERSSKLAIWIAAALVVLSVGLSRIYLGVHYPSDVVAGYLAAIVWISAVFEADAWFVRKLAQQTSPR